MTKRKITETVYEYDKDGKVTKKTVTETEEEDDTIYVPSWTQTPYTPYNSGPYYVTTTNQEGKPI